MAAEQGSRPWPTELRLGKDRKSLSVAFDNGESCDLPGFVERLIERLPGLA